MKKALLNFRFLKYAGRNTPGYAWLRYEITIRNLN
jgi:hypothetical protein